MRRRQIYAQRALEARQALEALTPAGFMGGPLVVDPDYTVPVTVNLPHGSCIKCGKAVGRGRAMHEKHCKGQ